MDPGRRAYSVESLFYLSRSFCSSSQRNQRNQKIYMNKNEQNEHGEVAPSMSADEDLTTGGIRVAIRYSRPVCGRVMGACRTMGRILSVLSPSAQTTAPRDRFCRLRCSSVYNVPPHCAHSIRSTGRERRIDNSATTGSAMKSRQ